MKEEYLAAVIVLPFILLGFCFVFQAFTGINPLWLLEAL